MPQPELTSTRGAARPAGDFRQKAAAKLRENGHTVTRSRIAVLTVLAITTKPVNAYDVCKMIAERGEPEMHSTTVYDTFRVLSEVGMLYETILNGKVKAFPRMMPDGLLVIDQRTEDAREIPQGPGLAAAMQRTAEDAGIDPVEFRFEIMQGGA